MSTSELIDGGTLLRFSKQHGSICEVCMLHALGYTSVKHVSDFPGQWRDCRSVRLHSIDSERFPYIPKSHRVSKNEKADSRSRPKYQDALSFLEYMSGSYGLTDMFDAPEDINFGSGIQTGIADTVPIHLATTPNARVLPFETLKELHEYYKMYRSNLQKHEVAKMTVFKKAFQSLPNVKLQHCSGSFNTCEVCGTLKKYLYQNRFSQAQKDVFVHFKNAHLDDNRQGRANYYHWAEEAEARGNYIPDENRYKYGLILPDGYTIHNCETPRTVGGKKGEKGCTMENRIVGVIVICGPINEVFLYHTDNLVSGGANLMVEVVRQTLIDLNRKLRALGLSMPKNLIGFYDNCGENKVKKYLFPAYVL